MMSKIYTILVTAVVRGHREFLITNTCVLLHYIKFFPLALAAVSTPGILTGAALTLTSKTFRAFINIWSISKREI